MKKFFVALILFLFDFLFTSSIHAYKPVKSNNLSEINPNASSVTYHELESDALPEMDNVGNIIPDFSNIGYMGSEVEIPLVPVKETLYPPLNGDAGAMIQEAINRVSKLTPDANGFRGAILLTKGRYSVAGTLNIVESGIVLRGEGEDAEVGTVLVAAGTTQRTFIKLTGTGSTWSLVPPLYNIKDNYVPVGRFWVRVSNPSSFTVGDDVLVYRKGTENWINDIKMNQFPLEAADDKHWTAAGMFLRYERKIIHIIGDTLHFDNPIMMAMEDKYGGGAVFKYSYSKRITKCGIENMLLESEFANSTDEAHAWTGIEMYSVTNSWVRNVTSKYFGYGLVNILMGSKYITVKNCKCLEPKSKIDASRRYSFCMNGGQLSLVIDCETTEGRHDYVTQGYNVGPNAFVRVKARNAHNDIGPHQHWNVGTLYDNIDTDGIINIQDRGNAGTGHGWAGANNVLWNCKASKICVQSPWVSAKNYSIGSFGEKYGGLFPDRPNGEWIKQNEVVLPKSLFEAQLELRKQTERLYHTKLNTSIKYNNTSTSTCKITTNNEMVGFQNLSFNNFCSIRIFNLNGICIKNFNLSKNDYQVLKLNKGLYFIQLNAGIEYESYKILI